MNMAEESLSPSEMRRAASVAENSILEGEVMNRRVQCTKKNCGRIFLCIELLV